MYMLVSWKNNDLLKCLDKWSKESSTQIDTKITFDNVFKTANDTCLWWFQYRLLYKLLPTGRFLYLRKLVDSPICSLCNQVEETLSHMLWDCPTIQDYWFDIQGWLHANFSHCSKILFSREFIILENKVNTVTDRIFVLFMLIAKYHVFTSRLQGTTPHPNIFIQKLKKQIFCWKIQLYSQLAV